MIEPASGDASDRTYHVPACPQNTEKSKDKEAVNAIVQLQLL